VRIVVLLLLILLLPCAHAQGAPEPLRQAIQDRLTARGEKKLPPFRYALTDLDGDRRDDAVVMLVGPSWCGTAGCVLLVFHATALGYDFVSETSAAREPVRVAAAASNGWRDLIVSTKNSGDVVLKYDGTRYPSDPWAQPRADAEQLATARTVLGG
jgi:hypothetical protein